MTLYTCMLAQACQFGFFEAISQTLKLWLFSNTFGFFWK